MSLLYKFSPGLVADAVVVNLVARGLEVEPVLLLVGIHPRVFVEPQPALRVGDVRFDLEVIQPHVVGS